MKETLDGRPMSSGMERTILLRPATISSHCARVGLHTEWGCRGVVSRVVLSGGGIRGFIVGEGSGAVLLSEFV